MARITFKQLLNLMGLGLSASVDPPVIPIEADTVTYSAPATVNVATTSTAILAANTSRKVATVVNDSDTAVYIAVGNAAVASSGIRLNGGGGSVQFGGQGGLPPTTQAIYGIHTGTGNKAVAVQEAE